LIEATFVTIQDRNQSVLPFMLGVKDVVKWLKLFNVSVKINPFRWYPCNRRAFLWQPLNKILKI